MRITTKRLLFAAILVVGMFAATSTSAQEEAGTEQTTTAAPTQTAPAPEPTYWQKNGCGTYVRVPAYRKWLRRAMRYSTKGGFSVKPYTRRKARRLLNLRRCAKTAKHRRQMLKIHNKRKARYERVRYMARMGNRGLGLYYASKRGWGGSQFSCLDSLWSKESGWNHRIWNTAGSGAYGIPQALPGSKMSSHGSDWETNPATQIRWGLDYIAGRYGTPCGAWGHSQSVGWY